MKTTKHIGHSAGSSDVAELHTPEPWLLAIVNPSPAQPGCEPYALWVSGAGPRLVQVDKSQCIAADDMRRIVACINYCAGLSTEYLETHKVEG